MEENKNRTRHIGLRLSPEEFLKIELKWKASTCRKLSEYIRRLIFDKPVITTYRNQSNDELINELSRLRKELNSIGGNINQAVRKLNSLHPGDDLRAWSNSFDSEIQALSGKITDIKAQVQKVVEQWLQ